MNTELDKTKLVQSKKASERKAVKKAYEEAILHRCLVTGETVDLAQVKKSTPLAFIKCQNAFLFHS